MGNDSLCKTSYYVVSSDFKLLEFNPVLTETHKDIKKGDICYKATMNRETPCKHCPIANKSENFNPIYYDAFLKDWIEAVFTQISDNKYAVISKPAKENDKNAISFLSEHIEPKLIEKVDGQAINHYLIDRDKSTLDVITALSSAFFTLYYIDLEANQFQELNAYSYIRNIFGINGDAKKAMTMAAQNIESADYYSIMQDFTNLDTLPDRLGNKRILAQEYFEDTTGWTRCCFIPIERNNNGRVTKVLCGLRDINAEKNIAQEQEELIRALSFYFEDVMVVEFETGKFKAFRISSSIKERYSSIFTSNNYEENINRYIENDVHPDDRVLFENFKTLKSLENLMASKSIHHFNYRLIRDGKLHYFQTQVIKLNSKNTTVAVAIRNIDEETEAELEKTKQLRDRMNIISSISQMFFCVYYIDLNNNYFTEMTENRNANVKKLIGSEGNAQEKLNLMKDNLVVPSQKEAVKKFVNLKTIKTRLRNKHHISIQFESPDISWCEGTFIATGLDEKGFCSNVLWAVRSIREEKQREIELKADETIQNIYQALGSSSWRMTFNEEGKAVSLKWNDDFFEITGIKPQQINLPEISLLKKIIHPDDLKPFLHNIVSAINDKTGSTAHDCEFRLKREKNKYNWYRSVGKPTRRKDGTPETFFGILMDIDEKKKADLELQESLVRERRITDQLFEAKTNADNANRAKSRFLFNMSHDIRTPMNAILGFSQLAKKHLNEPEILNSYLQNISTAGDTLLDIINNVLEISRIENGKITIEEKVQNTQKCFDDIIMLFQDEVSQKNLNLVIEKNISSEYLYFDKALISEVLLNILSNSIKYTPAGGTITCQINQIPIENKNGWCIMETTISDTGIGMSEEFQKHIFEDFERERNSTTSGIQGTGLGMGIAKKLINLMGGTIEVQSKLNVGTTFIIRSEHKLADKSDIAKEPVPEKNNELIDFTGRRILLAEDNELNAEITKEILESMGFIIDWVVDGVECVSQLTNCDSTYYDLILMDIQMPVMDGYAATQQIRKLSDKRKANIPIIAMTANAFEEDKRDAALVGMNGHISKPIDVNLLLQTLSKILKYR